MDGNKRAKKENTQCRDYAQCRTCLLLFDLYVDTYTYTHTLVTVWPMKRVAPTAVTQGEDAGHDGQSYTHGFIVTATNLNMSCC